MTMFRINKFLLFITLLTTEVLAHGSSEDIVRIQMDMRALSAALEIYQQDHGTYPSTSEGLAILINTGVETDNSKTQMYIKRLPKDPWGRDYQYLYPGQKNTGFDLWTLGADGSPGGTGRNTDYGNWPGSLDAYLEERRRNTLFQSIFSVAAGGALFGFILGLPILFFDRKNKTHKANVTRNQLTGTRIFIYLIVATPLLIFLLASIVWLVIESYSML